MLRHLALSSSLLIALCACQSQSADTATTAPAPAAKPTAIQPPHAATCPAPSFDEFFKRFADDVAVQRAYITDPLQSDSIDAEAEPEPAPVHKSLKKADVAFPLLPTTAQQASDGLNIATAHPDTSNIAVTLSKPDTDYQKVFHFRPMDGCWTLYRIEDESL